MSAKLRFNIAWAANTLLRVLLLNIGQYATCCSVATVITIANLHYCSCWYVRACWDTPIVPIAVIVGQLPLLPALKSPQYYQQPPATGSHGIKNVTFTTKLCLTMNTEIDENWAWPSCKNLAWWLPYSVASVRRHFSLPAQSCARWFYSFPVTFKTINWLRPQLQVVHVPSKRKRLF